MLAELCEFGGDDSLMGDMPEKSYAVAAKHIGHKVTCDVFQRGQPGINFLSRIFGPDVWTGDPNNMCDLARQMTKFHTSTDSTADPATKFTEKATSAVYTDSNTPMIGRYAKLWLNLNDITVPSKLTDPGKDTSWWSANFERVEQFVNEPAEWMDDVAMKHFPNFDWDRFYKWQPVTRHDMLCATSFDEPEELAPPKFDAVIIRGDEAEAVYAPTPANASVKVSQPLALQMTPPWKSISYSYTDTDTETDVEVETTEEEKYPLYNIKPITECMWCHQILKGTHEDKMHHELHCVNQESQLRQRPNLTRQDKPMLRIPLPQGARQKNTTTDKQSACMQVTRKGHKTSSKTHGRGKNLSGRRHSGKTEANKPKLKGSSKLSPSSSSV